MLSRNKQKKTEKLFVNAQKKGFTLMELMLATFISTLIIFGIVSAYISSINFIKKSGRHLRAQQEAVYCLNLLGDYIRSAFNPDVYDFTPPTYFNRVNKGNSLVTYNIDGSTSVFYIINNKMFCIPEFNFNTNTAFQIAKGIREDSYFFNDAGRICVNFIICDSDNTNSILFSSLIGFEPRN